MPVPPPARGARGLAGCGLPLLGRAGLKTQRESMHLVRAAKFKVGGCRLPVSTVHIRSCAGMGRMMWVSRGRLEESSVPPTLVCQPYSCSSSVSQRAFMTNLLKLIGIGSATCSQVSSQPRLAGVSDSPSLRRPPPHIRTWQRSCRGAVRALAPEGTPVPAIPGSPEQPLVWKNGPLPTGSEERS